jgi:formylglycine-generating enzyme required for sulfatase activity
MCNSLMRNYRTWLGMLIALVILTSGLCAVFVLGQSGTGRNNNANKNSPTPRGTSTPRTRPRPKRIKQPITKRPMADANELAYWQKIRLSQLPEDFKMYLDKYPKGKFVVEATNRLKSLENSKPVQEEVKPGDAEARKRPTPGTIAKNPMGTELVYVGPGYFLMGSDNGEKDEVPVHQVTIKEGFYMGRFEVTQAEWYQIMGKNPSSFQGTKLSDKQPVEQVSWDDVQDFLKILNQRHDGFYYRLPSEAEWEYACRAGTTGDYAGDLNLMAWYQHNSGAHTQPIGTRHPNAFGLYDMHGNVWEWCQDNGRNNYDGAPVDGSAWSSGGEAIRVLRGGSWTDTARSCRSARRLGLAQDSRFNYVGFRVVAIAQDSAAMSNLLFHLGAKVASNDKSKALKYVGR